MTRDLAAFVALQLSAVEEFHTHDSHRPPQSSEFHIPQLRGVVTAKASRLDQPFPGRSGRAFCRPTLCLFLRPARSLLGARALCRDLVGQPRAGGGAL